jgi:hypothetical protein
MQGEWERGEKRREGKGEKRRGIGNVWGGEDRGEKVEGRLRTGEGEGRRERGRRGVDLWECCWKMSKAECQI